EGLYQFSVVADARDFDWNELYITLNEFGNCNERTGPWDFDLHNQNKPLVPAYWVTIDGKKIGLWFFQRVSLRDLEAKKFRGRFAFHIAAEGEHIVELQPYRVMKITWESARLERDPEDRLEDHEDWIHDAHKKCVAWELADERFWVEKKKQLRSTHK